MNFWPCVSFSYTWISLYTFHFLFHPLVNSNKCLFKAETIWKRIFWFLWGIPTNLETLFCVCAWCYWTWKVVAPFAAVITHEISWLCQMWKCAGPKYLQILSYLVLRLAMLALQKTQMGSRVSESFVFSDLMWMKDNWIGSQNSWVLVLALSLTSCVLLDTLIFFYDPGFSPL